MTIARRLQVDPERVRFNHINARCVRREGFHDWGVALQDHRAAIKMEGE